MVFILNSSSAGRSLLNIQVFLTGIDIEHPTHLLGRLVHIGCSCGIGQILFFQAALHKPARVGVSRTFFREFYT